MKKEVPGRSEVSNVEDCEFILVYCHNVSPADSSSTTVAAQQILQGLPGAQLYGQTEAFINIMVTVGKM